jgi:hypothetical protein
MAKRIGVGFGGRINKVTTRRCAYIPKSSFSEGTTGESNVANPPEHTRLRSSLGRPRKLAMSSVIMRVLLLCLL